MAEQTEERERVRDSSDPWRPVPQPPCEPDCTCKGSFEVENDRVAAYVLREHGRALTEPSEPRTCTEADPCSFCGPVQRFWSLDPDPVPGGGDRLPKAPR